MLAMKALTAGEWRRQPDVLTNGCTHPTQRRRDSGVAGFKWDKGNPDKCQKHGVPLATIRVFHESLAVFPDPEHSAIEERLKAR
jgi:hypothetical protein